MTTDTFSAHRPRLLALAYRLLSSWAEAEDVVQETHLAWLERDATPLASERAWLERVTTNRCLDVLKSARVRREEYVGPWLAEPMASSAVQTEPLDVEAVSLAFLALLERLSPLERAVYVLAEAFDYSHDDIAKALQREPAAVRQLLHRAREHVQTGRPRFAPDKVAHESMLGTFFGAAMTGDVAALEQLLVAGATVSSDGGGKVRAAINVVTGANRVARFFVGVAKKQPLSVRYELLDVNGWPSVVSFEGDVVVGVSQLETDGERVYSVSTVVNPDKLRALTRHLAQRSEAQACHSDDASLVQRA
ncbi:MAG: RNA polymerase sigma factor SigJ [Myxococcus sp.]|nr:RNA polymerase sigma factor SigJ [Myxococcus sp.]